MADPYQYYYTMAFPYQYYHTMAFPYQYYYTMAFPYQYYYTMASAYTGEPIPPISLSEIPFRAMLGIGILTMFLFIMLLLFPFMEPCKMPRSADQNTCIICAGLDDLLFCKFARGFAVISIGCSIIAIVQGSLHDLNASHFAFMAAGAATTGYFAADRLRYACYDFHRPQRR